MHHCLCLCFACITYEGIVLFNVGNGVGDENFFRLTMTEIQDILKHYSPEVVLKFVSAYVSKKEIIMQNVNHTHTGIVIDKVSTDTVFKEASILNLNVDDCVNSSNQYVAIEFEDLTNSSSNTITDSSPVEPPESILEKETCKFIVH